MTDERNPISSRAPPPFFLLLPSSSPPLPHLAPPGVALQRLGRIEEAVASCDLVGDGLHIDESLLGTLAIVYNAAGKHASLTRKVEAAVANKPGDVGLLQALFKAHCREFAFVRMQQVSMKLFQSTQDQKYMLWAVVSNLLQAKCGERQAAAAKPEQLLQLAGMMAGRCVKPGCSFVEIGREALLVYLEVLHEQKNFPKALEIFCAFPHSAEPPTGPGTDLKDVMCRSEWEMLRSMLHLGAGDAEQALEFLLQFLSTVPGDIGALDSLLDVLFPGLKPDRRLHSGYLTYNPLDIAADLSAKLSSQIEPNRAWALAERAVAVFQKTSAPNKSAARGAALAPHCLILRKYRWYQSHGAAEDLTQLSGELAQLLLKFWEDYGDLRCCFFDIKASLEILHASDASWLRGELRAKAHELIELAKNEDTVNAKDGKKALQKVVSSFEICHEMSLLGVCDPPGTAAEVLGIFISTIHHARGLDEREYGPGDGLVPVAISLIMRDTELGLRTRAVQAVAVLNGVASITPYNADVRLCLATLYGHFCAPNLVQEQFDHLAIKNIQLESVAAQIGMPCFALCGSEHLGKSCATLAKFHWNHKHQVGDSLSAAIDNGAYMQAVDFVSFTRQLDRSFNRQAASVEDEICDLVNAIKTNVGASTSHLERAAGCVPQSYEDEEKLLDGMRFNSDLQVRPDWNAPLSFGSDEILGWWDLKSEHAGTPWWKRPRAAELENQCASHWREGLKCELRRRWCLIRMARNSLFTPGSSDASPLSFDVDHYLKCCGAPGILHSMSEGGSISFMQSRMLLRSLIAWIFMSADSVKMSLKFLEDLCGEERYETAHSGLGESSKRLQEVSCGVCLLVEKCKSIGLPLLALLLREPLTWISMLLHNWAKALQALKKRRKKVLLPQQEDIPYDDLRSVLQGFAQGLSGHLSSLKEIVEGQVETLEEGFAVDGLPLSPQIDALWEGQSPQARASKLLNLQASQSALLSTLSGFAEFHLAVSKAFKV